MCKATEAANTLVKPLRLKNERALVFFFLFTGLWAITSASFLHFQFIETVLSI